MSRSLEDPRSVALLAALRDISASLRADEVGTRLLRAVIDIAGSRGAALALDERDDAADVHETLGDVHGEPARVFVLRTHGATLGRLRVFAKADVDTVVLEALAAQAEVALANARTHGAALLRAEHDTLTGLANHGRIWEALEREATRAQRYDRPLAFVMFDVDRFKLWNDRLGHLAGDEALVRIAALVRERSRASDTAGRYGGDELALVLPETTHDGAIAVAEKIRAATEALVLGESGSGLTLSAGVASSPADGKTAADLMRVADARLYVAKAANGNRVIA